MSAALDATQGGTCRVGIARELLLEDLVQLLQRRRLHSVQRRHAQDDVQAHLVVEVAQHFAGLVGVEVGDHDGLDLRVLVADHIGNGARLHPLEAVQATGVATEQDAVDQAVGLVLAQCLVEHLADVGIGAHAQAGLVADDFDELAHHLLDLVTVHIAHLGHGHTHPLYFLGPHVPQHLGRVGLAQRKQEDCRLVDAAQLGGNGSVVTHRR